MIHGGYEYNAGNFILFLEPHAAMNAKRIFTRLKRQGSNSLYSLQATPETAVDLEWFMMRFPLECKKPESEKHLRSLADSHRERVLLLEHLIDANYQPKQYELALPPREYQRHGADWWLGTRRGILGDDVGLGKTITAICGIAGGGDTLPAAVVTLTHLQRQWQKELARFAPGLRPHIVRKGTPYELPTIKGRGPDVVILNYQKLDGWGDVLGRYCRSAVYDECQELRRSESNGQPTKKYAGAQALSSGPTMEYVLGMSATPIYNYGGEIYNVLDAIAPDQMPPWNEFSSEWCDSSDRTKASLRDPDAFKCWMRNNFLMLRRTRKEVGRELGRLQKITYTVDSNIAALDNVKGKAGELARIILNGSDKRGGVMNASEQLSNVLRQATGIAKAPYVAAFVRLLLESGEKVVLFGHHHAVYQIWRQELAEFNPVFYTGAESPAQKESSRERFIRGDSKLIIVALRSGVGLDGLQFASHTCVLGELDWSPAVHEQCIGRVDRDGQTEPVSAYFCVAEDGLDPIMCDVLGIKTEQVNGLLSIDPDRPLEQREDNTEAIKRVARKYLNSAAV